GTHHNDRQSALLAPGDQSCLGRHAVDGIDHHVTVGGNPLRQVGRGDKGQIGHDLNAWLNGTAALGQHLYLGAADGAVEGGKLAVDVGDTNVIEINQRELANP